MSQLKLLYLSGLMITVLFISSVANAANNTGVTDSLHEGETRVDLTYSLMGASPSGTYTAGTTSTSLSGQITQNSLATTYHFGVTDKINLSISYDLYQNTTQELDYTVVNNTQWQGATVPEIGIQYALTDKAQRGIGTVVYGIFSPASPLNAPPTAIKTVNFVTSSGVSGSIGYASATLRIGSTISVPVFIGSAFANFEYAYGGYSANSVAIPNVSIASLAFGFEDRISDATKLRPYFRASSVGGSYNNQDQSTAYSSYDVGVVLIKDISKSVSFEIAGQFSTLNNAVTNYANGDALNLSLSGYTVAFQSMFFY